MNLTLMKPDKEIKHGFHTDRFWPGRIFSEWTWNRISIRRDRSYHDSGHQKSKRTCWEFRIDGGFLGRRFAIRYEGKHKNV